MAPSTRIFWTADWLFPVASASLRTLQRLLPAGGVVQARATKTTRASGEIESDRPRPGLSGGPSRPETKNRLRHLKHILKLSPVSAAISRSVMPFAAKRITLARHAMHCSDFSDPAHIVKRCLLLRSQFHPNVCTHTASCVGAKVYTFFKDATLPQPLPKPGPDKPKVKSCADCAQDLRKD